MIYVCQDLKKMSRYKGAIDKLRIERGNECEECGVHQDKAKYLHRNGLEFAHVITTSLNGRGRGRADRYHDIKKYPTHYKLMCRLCHLEFDNKKGPSLPDNPTF